MGSRCLNLHLSPESTPRPLQVELAHVLELNRGVGVRGRGLGRPGGQGLTEQQRVQGQAPHAVGDALGETLAVDGGQGQGFFLPLGQALVHGEGLGGGRGGAVALQENLLQEALQCGPPPPLPPTSRARLLRSRSKPYLQTASSLKNQLNPI